MRERGIGKAYTCAECGYGTARWMGFCPQCKVQGVLRERTQGTGRPASTLALSEVAALPARSRLLSGMEEFDRALGGGIVPGSTVLVGGEPGVGKSTLILQVAAGISNRNDVVVVTAEESQEQVAARAARLGLDGAYLRLTSSTEVSSITSLIDEGRPGLVVVDSIQTVSSSAVDGAAGGVAQVRESAIALMAAAKRNETGLILVGHVTKDGHLAGPKLLEHMVDVVCSLEGDDPDGLRFLRSLKNRFGSVDQSGIFEMREDGLAGVADPSRLFMADRDPSATGSVLFPTIQGRRALLVEVQALVSPATSPQPRRSVKGLEPARVNQLIAVLERHAGVLLGHHDVFVGIAGGLKIKEPAVDMPLALALVSSALDAPLERIAAWGEVGLTGEVRPVGQADRRRGEAARLDVAAVIAPDEATRTVVDALSAAGFARHRMAAVS